MVQGGGLGVKRPEVHCQIKHPQLSTPRLWCAGFFSSFRSLLERLLGNAQERRDGSEIHSLDPQNSSWAVYMS